MQTSLARVLLILSGFRCLVGCSLPEAAAAPSERKNAQAHEVEDEERALDRRHMQLQNQVLSDLRKLRAAQEGSTRTASATSSDSPKSSAYKLLVFGGASHEVYLGCLCEGKNPESVFNLAGEFGSDQSANSLRNKFTPYGSNRGDTSACDAAAKHPPSVVASDGKSLGLLTMNASLKKRIAAPSVAEWLGRMCRL